MTEAQIATGANVCSQKWEVPLVVPTFRSRITIIEHNRLLRFLIFDRMTFTRHGGSISAGFGLRQLPGETCGAPRRVRAERDSASAGRGDGPGTRSPDKRGRLSGPRYDSPDTGRASPGPAIGLSGPGSVCPVLCARFVGPDTNVGSTTASCVAPISCSTARPPSTRWRRAATKSFASMSRSQSRSDRPAASSAANDGN